MLEICNVDMTKTDANDGPSSEMSLIWVYTVIK